MSGMFGYSREAVRVKVKKLEDNQTTEFRKFSVDPQITSFEVLQSILAKAFDLKGDFAICYRVYNVSGHETYIPLLSDWDLDAAFLKAYNMSMGSNTEPCLALRVDLKPFEECSDDWELRQNVPILTQIRMATCQEAIRPSPRLHGIFNQMGRTLNIVQKKLAFGDDSSNTTTTIHPPRPPLSDSEFRAFLDPVGQIIYAKELRSVIYFGGIDPSLRKVVWKHLLNVYPDGMTGKERMDYIKRKATEYINLREVWKSAVAQGTVNSELAYTTGMVKKDVLRTDRHHPFYGGSDDNQNIASLFNILTTYALNHPKVSYCQGMSDLASPLLVTMNDEAHAYICFCALMQRLSSNFMIDGIAMTQKFTHLAEGLMYYDQEFYNYLKNHQADDLLFCYRWLLLEMKREFAFDDSLRMLEVLWSSLPADPPEKELKLYDQQFQPKPITPPVSPLIKTPRENPYTKICELRRQSSSISLNQLHKKTNKVKRQIHSLDETIHCNKLISDNIKVKHQSLDDASLLLVSNQTLRPRSVSPLEQKSDSVFVNNRTNMFLNRSKMTSNSMTNLIKTGIKGGGGHHFKELKEKIAASKLFSSVDCLDTSSIKEEMEKIKLVKNFNEFINFTKPKINEMDDNGERTTNCDDSSSPDNSDYFPLTTSVTRELRLELENLDRKVFGDKCIDRLSESTSSMSSNCDLKCSEKRIKDDVFLWENPLHQTSHNNVIKSTPDEQTDIEYDSDLNEQKPKIEENTCEEVTELAKSPLLPPPNEFGGGNPFLMFLSITVLLQHREHVIRLGMDYNEMAMHFDKMVRKHNVTRVLNQARQMYARYIKQHTIAQQKNSSKHEDC